MVTKEEVMGMIAEVMDPELGLGVVDLGLIYDIEVIDEKTVYIGMTLTTPGCPYGPTLITEIESAVKRIPGVKNVDVDIVWDPPWNPAEMASEYAKDVLGLW
jgi:metal-sulfur cluster biosynthetic enzyme